MILWHELTSAEQRRYDHTFKTNVNPVTLSGEEFALLVQWLFVERHYTIQESTPHNNGYNFIIASHEGQELVHACQGNPPYTLLYDLQLTAKGKTYKHIHIYTFGKFSPAHKKELNTSPLFWDFVDRQQFLSRIEETRRLYAPDAPKPKPLPPLAWFGKQPNREPIDPYYTAPQPNAIDDELRAANRQAGPSKKRPDESDEEVVEVIYRPNRAPVYITRPRQSDFLQAAVQILTVSLIVLCAVIVTIIIPSLYPNETREFIDTILNQMNQPSIVEQTNIAVLTSNAQVSQTNQAIDTKNAIIATLNTTVTAIHLTNTAVSEKNIIVETFNAAANFTPTNSVTPTPSPTSTRSTSTTRSTTPSRTFTPTRTATKPR